MTDDDERFVTRWSRRKTEAREAARAEEAQPAPAPAAPLPELPKPETLTPDSDFRPFMDPRIDADTRRAALKMLFVDAHFNVPDPFEAYSGDYTVSEPIPMEMLKTLNHARRLIFDDSASPTAAQTADPEATDDGTGKQDA
jgi:hypothetical protein